MRETGLRLAIAACRAAYSGDEVPIDDWPTIQWGRLLAAADRHRVQALCWHGLGEAQGRAPAGVAEQFRARSRAVVEANLRAAAECVRLRSGFDRAGVDLLFLKGLTLGALAYPDNPMLKMAWDIDLLVSPLHIPQAARLLRELGYELIIPGPAHHLEEWHASRKESVWRKSDDGSTIDLHSRLADNPALLPDMGVRSPRQTVRVSAGIELPTLAKDELFAYLCVHGASSAWFRLKWIVDLAALLHREPTDEIARLYAQSQRLGAGRAADQGLLLACRLFGTAVPEKVWRQMEADRFSRWLADIAMTQLTNLREPTDRVLGTAAIHYSQPFLLPGLGFKLSELARQARSMLAS